ncbi:nitrate- and nitrite sensing domain-containing protein [Sulfuriflexus mobilis]|uniref:nitrate- and nitrite sensing domain-containing protein n=1 Tax=Sulfuriflexus mobilis TaxID=1811807 RepID=UPI000F81C985|nr:nitrate- and nitrite sensing domain-containing protein [Sulfuriflexus mobilis]
MMTDNALPLLTISLSFLLAFIFVIASDRGRKKQLRKRQQTGLQWLTGLRELLAYIQQHRGMTTGYLNGADGLLKDIAPLQKRVIRQLQDISGIGTWIETQPRWEDISQHWSGLAKDFKNHSVDTNLHQHNTLIQSILYLIDDMAQRHDLLLLKDEQDKPLHLLWRELLTASEYIGQARAIGTGVSAAGHCDSIATIRLKYLYQKIEAKTQRVWADISPNAKQQARVEDFMRCLDEQILRERPSIAPEAFFSIATAALDSLLEQYDTYVLVHR